MAEKIKGSSLFIGFLDLTLIAFLLYDFGFNAKAELMTHKVVILPLILLGLIGFNLYKYHRYRYDSQIRKRTKTSLIILIALVTFQTIIIIVNHNGSTIETSYAYRRIIEYGLIFYCIVRSTYLLHIIYRIYFNPAILFVGSFIAVILIGTFLLLLPSATTAPINFEDALFTSTSAVCVTGLLAVPTATGFTFFGQVIIMFLMQIGGLGMLTFTTFFAYFFKSGASVRENLVIKNVMGADELNSAMRTTMRIVVFSIIVEIIGAIFIYDAIKGLALENPIFFSVFHSVSAYCNAGFSIMDGNLTASILRYNYYLQWIIMILIIAGGLGFFISFNFLRYIQQFFINLFQKRKKRSIVRVITLNTKIVVITTIVLLVGGTSFLLLSEYNTVLATDNGPFGKLTTAMFSSVTARTTGFSTVNYAEFSLPGLLIVILLMWIGASPASTGGGIKTSTFALASLNILSTARNKPYIEIGTRRVAPTAVRRAFAIMAISLISIGLGILLILTFDPQFSLMEIAFETFSAFGTVGLSMGITDNLSPASEYVIIVMMFLGRIGTINLLAGILQNMETQSYEYPEDNILIN